jgi:DNA replicative helicase MCM subunit Mcm2 (Cdc46/Mcm family)
MGKCNSYKFTPLETQKVCIDYQEFRIQEHFKHIDSGKMPQNLTVIIEGSMSSNFRPGDDVTISGILDYRYKKPAKDIKMICQLIIFANSISLQKTHMA